jgi:hypothetical protein
MPHQNRARIRRRKKQGEKEEIKKNIYIQENN